MHPKELTIKDFTYHLPDKKIALYPAPERDSSKLLIYKNGIIREDIYKNIVEYLPKKSLLVFNDTKVIKARIKFQKSTAGEIEIFCLEPFDAINDYNVIMNKKENVRWKCMIGGASKWKEGELQLKIKNVELKIILKEKFSDAHVVEFSWIPADLSFAEVLSLTGDIPLPPYIKRKTEIDDANRYQTVYAKDEGSVAAPTAGLHFTEKIFQQFSKKNIAKDFVTLHVGAGTFKPVKTTNMQQHEMHAEWISVNIETIENLLCNLQNNIIAVGTTSARTLESLYWMGVKAFIQPDIKYLQLAQWEVYEEPLINNNIPATEALNALLNWLKKNNLAKFFTQTKILIAPGYHFKLINGIITNFHQPQSTLLLLVAAVVGNDWRKIYDYALENNFRFLSYGDGCLIFIDK